MTTRYAIVKDGLEIVHIISNTRRVVWPDGGVTFTPPDGHSHNGKDGSTYQLLAVEERETGTGEVLKLGTPYLDAGKVLADNTLESYVDPRTPEERRCEELCQELGNLTRAVAEVLDWLETLRGARTAVDQAVTGEDLRIALQPVVVFPAGLETVLDGWAAIRARHPDP